MVDIDNFEICSQPRDWNSSIHDLRIPEYRLQLQNLINTRCIMRSDNRFADRYRAHTNVQVKFMHMLPICMADVYATVDVCTVENVQPTYIRNMLTLTDTTVEVGTPAETLDLLRVTIIRDNTLREHKDELDREIQYNRVFSAACTSATTHICRVYVSENQHHIVVATNTVSNKMMQRLVATLPAMAPWITEKSEDFPIAMYQALGKDDAREYYTAFTAWQTKVVRPYFQEREKSRRIEYVKALYQVDTRSLQRSITQHEQQIQLTEGELYNYYNKLRELQLKLECLKNLPEANSPDIEYFLKHRRITFIDNANRPNAQYIRFGISTPCINYDKAMLTSFIESPRSNQYNDNPVYKNMYTELFLKDRYILWLHYNIVWSRRSAEHSWQLITESHVCTGDDAGSADIGILNPHLYHYQCYGQNASYINKALTDQDYILALEQSVACVGTLNFADGIVMQRLHSMLIHHNTTCVQDTETGEFLTIQQFKERISKE